MAIYEKINTLLHTWSLLTVIFRLVMAMLCGGAVGLMRSVRRRNAGFKTHSILCIGACLIMLTGVYIYWDFDSSFEVTRLAAQIVSGVGFLGVGTIIVTGKNHIQGLTTAAGLWTCAGIGIAIGIGFYSGAFIATGMMLFIYRYLENMDEIAYTRSRYMKVEMLFDTKRNISPVVKRIKEKYTVKSMDFGKMKKYKEEMVTLNLSLDVGTGTDHQDVLNELMAMEGVIIAKEI